MNLTILQKLLNIISVICFIIIVVGIFAFSICEIYFMFDLNAMGKIIAIKDGVGLSDVKVREIITFMVKNQFKVHKAIANFFSNS